jgi:hypothetical protein
VFGVLIPVGPESREVDRLRDGLDSVRAFEESQDIHLVVIDDSPVPRPLPVAVDDWASVDIVRTSLWDGTAPDPYSAMVAGTLDGVRAASAHQPEFLLKVDTDALLIGPVSKKLRMILADQRVGIVGSYTHTCTGAQREWAGWKSKLLRAQLPVAMVPNRTIRPRSIKAARSARNLLTRARANGYELGQHCLGGAYAIGEGLLAREDLLDWHPWVRTGLGEDVVLGLLVAAAGLTLRGAVAPGEVFALAWQGLPLPPGEIVALGYSVVHSVRDQPFGTEAELRSYFRRRRTDHATRTPAPAQRR